MSLARFSVRRASSLVLAVVLFWALISIITTSSLTAGRSQEDEREQQPHQRQERLFYQPGKQTYFTKTLSLLNSALRGSINKASPLYLINGTICRYINNAPICTVLATTGLQTTASVGAGGQSQGGARPATSGSSGSSGGAGSAPSGGSPAAGGAPGGAPGGAGRPSTSGQLAGGSSVQYLGRPLADDSLDLQASSGQMGAALSEPMQASPDGRPPVGVLVRRRPPMLLPFGLRRPLTMQPQLRRQLLTRQQQQQLSSTGRNSSSTQLGI